MRPPQFVVLTISSIVLVGLGAADRGPVNAVSRTAHYEGHRSPVVVGVAPMRQVRQGPSSQSGNIGHSLAPTIDGSITPDAIPDRVAYRHLIAAAAASNTSPQSAVARRDFILNQLGLSESDRLALLDSLDKVANRLSQASRESNTSARVIARNAILDEAQLQVQSVLTLDGVIRVQEYLRHHVKPRTKIFGAVPR